MTLLKTEGFTHLLSVEREALPSVLITGVTSIHGWPIYQAMKEIWPEEKLWGVQPPKGVIESSSASLSSLCLTDKAGLNELSQAFSPDVIIHAGGVCDLDVCEVRPQWAHSINVGGAETLLELFPKARIYYFSSDLVYSGTNPPEGGYSEDITVDPVSVVGKTYFGAEQVFTGHSDSTILRVALPLGPSCQGSKGAYDWIEGRFRRGLKATLFHDELRSCIACKEIARTFLKIFDQDLKGLFHLGGPRPWTLFEIGELVLSRGGYDTDLLIPSYRHLEVDGPPRIGDVSLNSTKLENAINDRIQPTECEWE